MTSPNQPVPEPAAAEFAAATATPPYLFDLGPIEGRKTTDEVQSYATAAWVAEPGLDAHRSRWPEIRWAAT
jgi:hypothetical protein